MRTAEPTEPVPAAPPSLPRIAAASLAGTAIEFYDFFIYGTAAALVLGPLFFPTFSPLAGTLAAFATFGVGFVARPLGSVVFGHIGDRHGRRPMLLASLLLTGIATVAVGCVPTYESIGIGAPLLLKSLGKCAVLGGGPARGRRARAAHLAGGEPGLPAAAAARARTARRGGPGHWRLVLLTAGAMAVGYAVFYAVTTWSLAYGVERLGVSRTVMLACVMAAVVVKGALTPVVAVLGDRFGRRPLCLIGCAASALWMFPMVALLSTGEPLAMFTGFLVALLAFITMFAVVAAYLPELYEPQVRCTGAAVGYNLGGALGGALTPIVATALAQGDRKPWGVAAYLSGTALLSLGCFALLPETRPVAASDPAAATG